MLSVEEDERVWVFGSGVGMSCMKTLNSVGDSAEPCGTSLVYILM